MKMQLQMRKFSFFQNEKFEWGQIKRKDNFFFILDAVDGSTAQHRLTYKLQTIVHFPTKVASLARKSVQK